MYGSDNNSPDPGFELFSFKDIALAILIVAVLGWTTTSRSAVGIPVKDADMSEETNCIDHEGNPMDCQSEPEQQASEEVENPDRTEDERKQAISDEVATLDEKEEHQLKCDKPNYIIYSSYDEAQEAADKDSDNNCTVEPKI